jgi:lipoprotein-releasing system permease protein
MRELLLAHLVNQRRRLRKLKQLLLGLQFLPKDIYFINSLPSDPRLPDIATIGAVSVVMSLLATLYPSYSASRVKPAEALRYE